MTDVLQAPNGDSPTVFNKLQLQQITIPPELPSILKRYAKAAIRTQPPDLLVWSAAYFKALSSGIPPPVKERIEYPPVIIASGLTPGFLKVLINQVGRDEAKVIPKSTLVERWTDICLSKEALEEIFNVGAFYKDTITWLKFVAICAGYLESRLSRTMVLLIELLNLEPEEKVPIIPVKKFLILYRYLAVMDCGPVDQRRSTTCDVSSLGTEVSPVAGHLTNTRTPVEDGVVPEVKSVEPAVIKEVMGNESESEFINNDDNKNNPDKVINEDNQIEIEENGAEIKEPVANIMQCVDDICGIETDGEGSKPVSPTITAGIDAVEEKNSNAESHVTGENLSQSDSSTLAENKERIAVNLQEEVDDDSKEAEGTKGKEEIECPADKTGENEMEVQKTVDLDNDEEEEKKSDNLETKDETIIPMDKTDESEEKGEKTVDTDDSEKDEEQPGITSDTKNGTPINESPTNKTGADEEEEEKAIVATDEIQEPRVTPEAEDQIVSPTDKNEGAEEEEGVTSDTKNGTPINESPTNKTEADEEKEAIDGTVDEGNREKEGEHYEVTPEIKDEVVSPTEKTEEEERESEKTEDGNGDIKGEELQKDTEEPADSEKAEVKNNIDENNKTEEFRELENDQRDNEISDAGNDEDGQHLAGIKSAEDGSESAKEEKEANETEKKENNDENEGKTNEEDQTGHEKLETTAEIIVTNDEEQPGVTSDTKNGTPINESPINKTEADEEEEAIDGSDEIQEEKKDKLTIVDNEESSEKEEGKAETEEETKKKDLEEPSEEEETGEENIALGIETNKEEDQGRESHVEKEVEKEEVVGEVEMAREIEESIEPEDAGEEVQQEEENEKTEVEEGKEKSESEEVIGKENRNEYEQKDNEISGASNDEVGQQESEDKQKESDQEKPAEVENKKNEIDQEQIQQLATQGEEDVEPFADITYSDNTSEHSGEKQDMKPETDSTEADKTIAEDGAKEVGEMEISESDDKISEKNSTFDNIESLDVNSIKGFDEEDGRISTQEEEKTENSAKSKTPEAENLTETVQSRTKVQTNKSVKEPIEDSSDASDDATEEKSADHDNRINKVEAIDNIESSADVNNKDDSNLQKLEYRKTDDETIANELLQVIKSSSDENITRDVETGKNGNEENTEEDGTNNDNETLTSNPDNTEEEEPKDGLFTNEEDNKSESKIEVEQENDTIGVSLESNTTNKNQLIADKESSKQRTDLEHVDVHADPNNEETANENDQEVKDPETGIVTKPSRSSQEITDSTENGYKLDQCTTEESGSKTDDKDKVSEFSEVKKENSDITVEEDDDDKSSIVKENDCETQKSFDETEDILQADVISLQQGNLGSVPQSKSDIIENGELNEKDSDNMNVQKINIVRGEETLDEMLHMVDIYKEDSQSREDINDNITTKVEENQGDIELNNNKETEEEDLQQRTDQLKSESSARSGRSRFAGVVKSGAEWSTLPAYYAYIPGIGPPVPDERIERVEKYLTEVSARQAGYVMASNLRHYLCPPLDP